MNWLDPSLLKRRELNSGKCWWKNDRTRETDGGFCPGLDLPARGKEVEKVIYFYFSTSINSVVDLVAL